MAVDRFGNMIDASVGYARGRHLTSSAAEIRRLRHAQSVAARVAAERGIDAIGIFTGNPRRFPLKPGDIETCCEEWVGPGLFAGEFLEAAQAHFGGGEAAAVVNRTSAGIVAAVLALSGGLPVVSIVPAGDRSHASVVRGCKLAGVELAEFPGSEIPAGFIQEHRPELVIVTTVTSTLARLRDDVTCRAIAAGKAVGAAVLLDEAYGARLRPVLHGGAPSLKMGADLAITNADKAGLSGPRAGILCGASEPVLAVLAKASELGLEARAPIAAGAMRSLQRFAPEDLATEAREGRLIADALAASWGEDAVLRSDLGPMIAEEQVLAHILALARRERTDFVPAEAATAVGMVLLRDNGILTTNSHGAPGGRVSLRLKPTAGALRAVGGSEALVKALNRAILEVADNLDNPDWLRDLLFGERC